MESARNRHVKIGSIDIGLLSVVAEDEAAYEDAAQTFMEVPKELVPKVRELIAKHLG
jgi:hypothetical protein